MVPGKRKTAACRLPGVACSWLCRTVTPRVCLRIHSASLTLPPRPLTGRARAAGQAPEWVATAGVWDQPAIQLLLGGHQATALLEKVQPGGRGWPAASPIMVDRG